jgi:hypothetical protein
MVTGTPVATRNRTALQRFLARGGALCGSAPRVLLARASSALPQRLRLPPPWRAVAACTCYRRRCRRSKTWIRAASIAKSSLRRTCPTGALLMLSTFTAQVCSTRTRVVLPSTSISGRITLGLTLDDVGATSTVDNSESWSDWRITPKRLPLCSRPLAPRRAGSGTTSPRIIRMH